MKINRKKRKGFAFYKKTGIRSMILLISFSLLIFNANAFFAVYASSDYISGKTSSVWRNIPLGGGGYVTGIVCNSDGSTIYCRTDVGGVYRWKADSDGVNGKWVPLSDNLVPYNTIGADAAMSVDGIGVDPNNLDRVYIGVGTKWSSLKGIFCSDDRGDTWTQINSTIRMNGNGAYRNCGERLAVDPNNPNIVWYGSCFDGLQKGVKDGDTWTWTQVPTTSVPIGYDEAGVAFVVCDKNDGINTIVYAGVHGTSDGGIYKSSDNGETWTKISTETFLNPNRAQISANGTLYVTGGTAGVAKITRDGTFTVLSALPAVDAYKNAISYHAVAVDPNDSSGNTVYVSQSKSSACMLWRSVDGGVTWAKQDTTFNEGPISSGNHARTEPDGTKCVTGYWFGSNTSLMVNPTNSNELWLADFFGVQRTSNAQDIGTNPGAWWYTLQKGHEETVALALKNAPTGPKLMMGVSDVGGYRYTDTTVRPYGNAGSPMGNPGGGNVTSVDFSESDNNIWARTWVEQGYAGSTGSGAVSSDAGQSWLLFGQIDKKSIANSSTSGWESFDVGTYIAKQKEKGNNIVTLVVASSNTSDYSRNILSFSSKEADDDTLAPKITFNDGTSIKPVADCMVNGGTQTTNYGNGKTLSLRYYYDQEPNSYWFYLKFDLSNVNPFTSAQLQLHRVESSNTTIFPVGVYSCTDTAWVEGDGGSDNQPENELTWNNKPRTLANKNNPQNTANYYTGSKSLSGGRVAVSAVNPDVMVWEPVNSVPYYSNDRGASWTESQGAPTSQIVGVYTNGNSVSISGQPLTADRGNGNFYIGKFGGSAHVIYRSTDNGATWSQVSTVSNGNSYNMRNPQLVAAPVSPDCPDGGDIWLCDDGSYNNNGGGLWHSTNSAESWTKISGGVGKIKEVTFGKSLTGEGYTVYIHGYINGILGVYQSDDYCKTWSKLADPSIKEITSLAGDRQNYGKVYIGTGGRGTFYNDNEIVYTEDFTIDDLAVAENTVKCNVTNNTGKTVSGLLVVELYDKNNLKAEQIIIQSSLINPLIKTPFSVNFDSLLNNQSEYGIKVFLWDAIEKMHPMAISTGIVN